MTNGLFRVSATPPGTGTRWTIVLIATLLLVYTTIRAATVSFTYDEAYTFMNHVRKGLFFQDTFDPMGANHHLLNVWSMWGSWKLFGDSELALRLPNLIAHVLYLYGGARIALRASSAILSIGVFLVLNLHPYLLDFFSLARGYGLSCGFLMVALWCAFRALVADGRRSHALWGILFAGFATMAHSILVNVQLGMTTFFVARWLMEDRQQRTQGSLLTVGGALLIVLLSLMVLLPNAVGLYKGGSLYFGTDSLWSGMMESLATKFLYHYPYGSGPLSILGRLLAAIGTWVLITLLMVRRRNDRATAVAFALMVLFMTLLSLWVQHVLLGLPWPRSRTALFLVPLLAFLLVTALLAWQRTRAVPTIVVLLFCVPLIAHMGRCWNRTHVVEWKPSGELRTMLEIIAQDHLPLTTSRPLVTMSTGEECSGSLDYYIHSRDWPWLMNTVRFQPELFPNSDYYIVEYNGQHEVDRVHWSLLYHSDETNTSLFRDERTRRMDLSVVHQESLDMEPRGVVGATTEDHVSGTQALRLDTHTHRPEPLEWVVPQEWDGSAVLATGSLMTKERDEGNWLTLSIQLIRDGKVVEERDAASHKQILRYGEWGRVAIELRTMEPLRSGDVIRFDAALFGPEPHILVDDMDLWILR
jgi:hypothetical protein